MGETVQTVQFVEGQLAQIKALKSAYFFGELEIMLNVASKQASM